MVFIIPNKQIKLYSHTYPCYQPVLPYTYITQWQESVSHSMCRGIARSNKRYV